MNILDYLSFMKATNIPSQWSGIWYVSKTKIEKVTQSVRHGKPVVVPRGMYTYLYRLTDETLYSEPPGEVIMEDTPFELQTHLGFVIHAYGQVLVTGLGLGCVIRGLQANPNVERITCIENSLDVLKLIVPHIKKDKLDIIQADAFEWTAKNKRIFDCAWHDIWANREIGEPHLDHLHVRLMMNCKDFITYQGAWEFDRTAKRMLKRRGFQWIG